ncbi:MAG: phosphatase PAP2 family protein [Burkholderiales bacterium]|nr:phosphatase PAP2 family protein [Burkholderiales bacterium]
MASHAVQAAPPTDPNLLKQLRPGFVEGYLPSGTWVDSLALLPPPPAAGSPAHAADDAVFQLSRTLKDSPRWLQAEKDSVLAFPKAPQAFQCALGITISAEATPHLNMLMRRTLADAGLATYKAKDFYKRQRPFMAGNDAICTPKDEASLRKDGSYPSGHSALGWAWGLVLSEIAPERSNALAQRAKAFGQSRAVCGVHWQSDVDAGQLVASAVVAQLHGNATFTEQLALARAEVEAARKAGTSAATAEECALETQALTKPAAEPAK